MELEEVDKRERSKKSGKRKEEEMKVREEKRENKDGGRK